MKKPPYRVSTEHGGNKCLHFTNEQIDDAIGKLPENDMFKALLLGVKHHGIKLILTHGEQSPTPIPKVGGGTVVLLDDGDLTAKTFNLGNGGPTAFHHESLKHLFATAHNIVINASDSTAMASVPAVFIAGIGGVAVIIDTVEEHFSAWAEHVTAHRAVDLPLLLIGPRNKLPPRIWAAATTFQ